MDLQTHVRRGWVKGLVQQRIFCPISQDVLDVRTCVVVLDEDDDPVAVMSPTGYKRVMEIAETYGEKPLRDGLHWDPDTIPA